MNDEKNVSLNLPSDAEIRKWIETIFPPGTPPEQVRAFVHLLIGLVDPGQDSRFELAKLSCLHAWAQTDDYHFRFEVFAQLPVPLSGLLATAEESPAETIN